MNMEDEHAEHEHGQDFIAKEYKKFWAIIIGLGLLSVFMTWGAMSVEEWMRNYMGLVFVTFGFSKFLIYEQAVYGLMEYDWLAKRFKPYAFIYPFIELILGASYLFNLWPRGRNIVALVVLLIGAYGINQSLKRHSQFQCLCLGALAKVPLSKITLGEYLIMGAMSLYMLVF